MWLYISVLGKVEHTSLVHGQTKVINKLVHRFIFFIFSILQEMLETTWNGRNLTEARGKEMFGKTSWSLISPEAAGDENVEHSRALWVDQPPRTTSVSAPAPSLSGTSQLLAQTSAGVTSEGRRIPEVGAGLVHSHWSRSLGIMMLLRHLSYVIKTQLKAKPPQNYSVS